MAMLTSEQLASIGALGFEQLLSMEVDAVESRNLLPWLMDRVDPDTMIYYLDDLDHKKSLVHWISTARVRFYNCGIIEALTIADRIRKNDGTETYGFVREIIKIICSGESAVHK